MKELLKALDEAYPFKRVEAPPWFLEKHGMVEVAFTVDKDTVIDDSFWGKAEKMVQDLREVEEFDPPPKYTTASE